MTNGRWLLLVLLISGLFIFRECGHSSEKESLEQTIASLESYMEKEKESFTAQMEIEVNSRKDMQQQLVHSIDDIKQIKEQYKDLKRITSVIKAELHASIGGKIEYKHDTLYLSANTDSLIPRDSVNKYFIPKGTKASKHDPWYDISLTLNDSLEIDSLLVRDKIDAVLGWKKPEGKSFQFLRKREPVVSIQSYSPYTSIGHINNLVVEDKKSTFVKVLSSKPMMFLYGVGTAFAYQGLK